MIAAELHQELGKANFVSVTIDASTRKSRDAGERRHDGVLLVWPFVRGATEMPFYKSIIGNFMVYQDRLKTYLLQLLAHPETLWWFSVIHVIIFKVNIVAAQKQALLVKIFCFLKVPFPSTLYCPLPYRCSGVFGREGKIFHCGSLICAWYRRKSF